MNFEINTERLVLRPPSRDDVDRLFLLMSDNIVTQFLSWEAHSNIDTTKGLILSLIEAQRNDKGYHWCVWLDNEIIGLVSLIDVKRQIRTWTFNRAELSYWIGSNYQRKGYATEGCRSIIEYGFSRLDLHKIIVAHVTENIESQKICNKLSFTKYAYEHDAFQKNNKWHDLIWYELIKQK